MRCVRLVCGQCGGLWSDLESHLVVEHGMEDTCVTCGLAPVADLLEPSHSCTLTHTLKLLQYHKLF